ncbi:MAG: MBL fold metallo-hydrolase [Candidatus Bathyarchaeota archaeon]
MIFEQVKAEDGDNFSYIVGDEDSKEVAIVDPSFSADQLIGIAEQRGLKVKYVVDTHSHRDHTEDNGTIAKLFNAKIVVHRSARIEKDSSVDDGNVIDIGKVKIQVIHSPGHTPDSICLLVDGKVLTGDTLFVGECGRTDMLGGSSEDLYHSLFDKLMKLDDSVEVYPGHDYGSTPHSTIGLERQTNFVLEKRTLKEFIEFMRT